ncbi:MAG: hypothetical protein RMI01_05115 [Thermodesulfovibrio sp.]|nr:hypothetical protein [Thermodesulfovibrio sp.]
MEFFDGGFFPGKEDQYGYYEYGLGCRDGKHTIQDAFENYQIFYYVIVCLIFLNDILPKQSMILINYILLILTVLFSYKTVYVLTESKKRAVSSALILGILPGFLGFSIYMIRDLFILFFSSATFYYLILLYKLRKPLSSKLVFLIPLNFSVVTIFNYLIRPHLAFIFTYIFLNLYVARLISLRKTALILIISFLNLMLLNLAINSFLPDRNYLYPVINELLNNHEFLWNTTKKIFLYSVGLGFLDAETVKSFDLIGLLIMRLLAIDSLILPPIFFLMLIQNKFRRDIGLIIAVMSGYLIYAAVYFYAEKYYVGVYGFHFRAYLPFYYFFVIMLFSNINIEKYRISLWNNNNLDSRRYKSSPEHRSLIVQQA